MLGALPVAARVIDRTPVPATITRMEVSTEGGSSTLSKVGTLVLLRMRPPPFYNFQITESVRKTFAGEIIIAADGEEVETPRP